LAFAVRPDAMSLFLTILSVYLFSKAYFQKQHLYYIYCGVTFGISFFSKQDSFLILSALGFFLLINKRWKELLTLALSFLISFISLLIISKVVFGNFFLFSIGGGLSLGYSFNQAKEVFLHFLSFYNISFCAGLLVSIVTFKKALPEKQASFLLILSSSSFLIAMVTSFKLGSWMNYYTPFVIYTVMLIYYVINYFNENSNRVFLIVCLTIVHVLFFIYSQAFHYTAPFLNYKSSKAKYIAIAENFKNFKEEADSNKYVIFTFDKMLKLVLYRNTIFPNTEYYHVSRFSFEGYKKLNSFKKLTHVIKNNDIGNSQFSTLDYYQIPLLDFKEKNQVLNYTIYEYGR